MKIKILSTLLMSVFVFSGCQSSETNDMDSTEANAAVDIGSGEDHFLPEDEGWLPFANENIRFSYPKEFTVKEDGDNIYLTNSESSAPLGMNQGEIWISFSPSSQEGMEHGASEGVALEKDATNGEGDWYKMELLIGGNGELTEEAEDIFEKVESRFFVL